MTTRRKWHFYIMGWRLQCGVLALGERFCGETAARHSKHFHFLPNLWMDPISYSVCPWRAFPSQCIIALWLIGPIRKLQRKLIVINMVPGAVFTPLYYLCNSRIDPISLSVEFHKVEKGFQRQILRLIQPIFKLQRQVSFFTIHSQMTKRQVD